MSLPSAIHREDYNKLAVKAAKPIAEAPKPAGDGPSDAMQVIGAGDKTYWAGKNNCYWATRIDSRLAGGAGALIVVALFAFAAAVFVPASMPWNPYQDFGFTSFSVGPPPPEQSRLDFALFNGPRDFI